MMLWFGTMHLLVLFSSLVWRLGRAQDTERQQWQQQQQQRQREENRWERKGRTSRSRTAQLSLILRLAAAGDLRHDPLQPIVKRSDSADLELLIRGVRPCDQRTNRDAIQARVLVQEHPTLQTGMDGIHMRLRLLRMKLCIHFLRLRSRGMSRGDTESEGESEEERPPVSWGGLTTSRDTASIRGSHPLYA